tara:strand:- start:735 stop:905 length:171 start_codon:yes stop_codon:yes gene_type:complete
MAFKDSDKSNATGYSKENMYLDMEIILERLRTHYSQSTYMDGSFAVYAKTIMGSTS